MQPVCTQSSCKQGSLLPGVFTCGSVSHRSFSSRLRNPRKNTAWLLRYRFLGRVGGVVSLCFSILFWEGASALFSFLLMFIL